MFVSVKQVRGKSGEVLQVPAVDVTGDLPGGTNGFLTFIDRATNSYKGAYIDAAFYVLRESGSNIATITAGGIDLAAGKAFSVNGVPIAGSSGASMGKAAALAARVAPF